MKATKEKICLPRGQSFRVIRWSRNLEEVESVGGNGEVEKVSGEGSHWHYHAEMELTWFRKGRGTRFVGDRIERFEAGEVVLLGRNLPHYWHVEGRSSGISLQWNFPRGHAFWLLPEAAELEGLFKKASKGIRFAGGEADFAGEAMEEMTTLEGLARLGRLLSLLGYLAGLEEQDGALISARSFSLAEGSAHRGAMEKAVRYVIANFRDSIPLEDLLEITAMSRATFSRQFHVHTGRSFSKFLLQLRLETACRELSETDRTITEIAYACGFGQISFFNRSFRKAMGCSPSEFRNR